MTVALLVLTDGRGDYLKRTVESARRHLRGDISERWLHDDSGDEDFRAWLRAEFPEFRLIGAGPRRGFSGAMRSAWQHLIEESTARWAMHVEGDFTFNRPVDLDALARFLDAHPRLAQVALLRQPWYDWDRAAGGIIQAHPDEYTARTWRGHPWLEHRRLWTCNPSLYPWRLMLRDWPEGPDSEDRFGVELFADPVGWSAAYWGDGRPWVTHIGAERAGCGY